VARAGGTDLERSCLFCQKGKSKRLKRDRVVARGRFAFSLMNLFPYSNGHLMIAPYRHVPDLKSLTPEEQADLFVVINDALARLGEALRPQGFNLGANLGRAAGAGIPGHLHFHIVPRIASGDLPAVVTPFIEPTKAFDSTTPLIRCC
jgi:ATP adenylyltransferase